MRKSVILFCAALLAGLVWLCFRPHFSGGEGKPIGQVGLTNNNASSAQAASTVFNKAQQTKRQRTNAAEIAKYYDPKIRDPFLEWKQPINFFGRIIDENDQPVAGANISFVWNDISDKGTSDAQTTSDSRGLFSLTGKHGKGLSVTIGKDGYYTPAESRLASFEYGNPFERFIPDSRNPVIFHLRKKGKAEPLVAITGGLNPKRFSVPLDGTPLRIDLLTGTQSLVGNFQVKYLISDLTPDSNRRFDWAFEVSVPQGGILLSTNELDFIAPKEGYETAISMAFDPADERWKSSVKQNYFVKLPGGKFGRLRFELYASKEPFCLLLESFVNPSGSRNLEYDPKVQPKAPIGE